MKKFLFLGLAAMMAFTSCTKDETLAVAQNGEIGFDVAADKATRSVVDPSITTANIDNFAVYGFMDNVSGAVFTDELVTKQGGAWSYQNTQYWVAGKNYYFAALAPSNDRAWTLDESNASTLGIGTVSFTNDGTQDLLYWAQGPIVGQASNNAKVGVVFNHLLSKVKFSFVNQFDNANAYIVVKDIVITNAETEGTIDLAVENWWDGKEDWSVKTPAAFAFGNAATTALDGKDKIAQFKEIESYNEMLLFPVNNKTFTITFAVELYMGEVLADTYNHSIDVTTTLEMGKAYDFKATFNAKNIIDPDDPTHPEDVLQPIEFEVTVIDWVQAGEVEVNYEVIDTDATLKDKKLESDATVDGNVTVEGTFDGAGFTVTPINPTEKGGVYPFMTLVPGTTVQNVTIDGQNAAAVKDNVTYGIRGLFINQAGEYTIKNVKIYNVTYPIHVNTSADVTLHVSNSVLEGWTSYGESTTADFTEVSFEKGTYARFRPYGTTVLTNCSFEEGFVIDLKYVGANEKVTFVNCKYAGQPLTAANLTGAVDGKYEIQ